MTEYVNEKEPTFSPALPLHRLFGSSPFAPAPCIASPPIAPSPLSSSIVSPDVRLLPIQKQEPTRLSSLELLNALGDGFRNDEYYDTIDRRKQGDLKAAWRNVEISDSTSLGNQSKFLIRKGIPDDLRQKVWMTLSGWSAISKEKPNLYADALQRAFGSGDKPPSLFRSYPLFGGIISPSDHFLIDESDELVRRLLVVIGLEFPLVDYCPSMPDILQILLTFMGEADTYGVMACMLERSQDVRKYILISKNEHMKFCAAFLQVLSKLIPRLHRHITSILIIEKDSYDFLFTWFSRLFVASFPYQAVLRSFDAFMNEGVKIFYRIALAVLDHNKDVLLQTSTAKEFKAILNAQTRNCTPTFDTMMKAGFAFQLRRSDMEMDFVPPAHVEDFEPVFYRPKIATSSAIIEDDKFEIIWSWIPHRICIRDPYLLYAGEKHGWSLSTIVYRCKNDAPLLFIIKSESNEIFGAYLTHSPSPARPDFYGDRDCFLFTLAPATSCYKWTMKNDLFMRCHADFICLGSGGKGHGLFIHKDMWGRTAYCETYDNPPLETTNSDHFQILALEVYAFR